MSRPSMIEINVKRDQNIRAMVKKLKKERLKRCANGGSGKAIREEIMREVGERFNLASSTIELICRDPYYSLRYLKRQQERKGAA